MGIDAKNCLSFICALCIVFNHDRFIYIDLCIFKGSHWWCQKLDHTKSI